MSEEVTGHEDRHPDLSKPFSNDELTRVRAMLAEEMTSNNDARRGIGWAAMSARLLANLDALR